MIKTFIYGSCVSRDTFEFLDPNRFTLLEYLARQSIVSALSPAPDADIPRADLPSAFQRRMLENDWRGSLLQRLTEQRKDIDLILWDLCDERLGVRKIGSSSPPSFVTRSVESIASGIDAQISGNAHYDFGSATHFKFYTQALRHFLAYLEHSGLRRKIIAIAPQWATHANDGTPSQPSFGRTPETANRQFRRYYSQIKHHLNIPIITAPQKMLFSDAQHKWGPAPFHYTPEVYQYLADSVGRSRLPASG